MSNQVGLHVVSATANFQSFAILLVVFLVDRFIITVLVQFQHLLHVVPALSHRVLSLAKAHCQTNNLNKKHIRNWPVNVLHTKFCKSKKNGNVGNFHCPTMVFSALLRKSKKCLGKQKLSPLFENQLHQYSAKTKHLAFKTPQGPKHSHSFSLNTFRHL